MVSYNRLRRENEKINERNLAEIYGWQSDLDSIAISADRTAKIARYSESIIEDIDSQFEKATKLNKTDITFLLLATGLQCIRQYIIGTITQRTDDKTAARKTNGHGDEHSDRSHRLYNPSLDEIITNPVPFDAIFGGKEFDLGIGGGFTHRAKTVGHDPLLGWIFGTMNIATSTVTVSEGLRSFHVLTGYASNGAARDKISMHADTFKILDSCKRKLLDEGIEGKEKIGESLKKEAIHLKSDIYSTASLPLPIISTISVKSARDLASYGLDMGNCVKIGSQAAFAILINSLIGMIHGLLYDESIYLSKDLYSVKTRKILSYSNLIASASNVIAVAIAAAVGISSGNPEVIKKSVNYLDIGGIMVTIYRVISDRNFICAVKKEFLSQQWYSIVLEG
ncbi:MAG: hypothetical protein Q4F41_12285 [Eubacteriales bacterium]|nr:hypothetical protein [Eubacteriales bacterium]